MTDQVRVFSRSGVCIGWLRTSVDRAWSISSEASAKFYLSVYDANCNPFILNYGNLILVENSDGLPPWVGMIDQRGFEKGACVIWAYTPERYFRYRRGPRSLKLTGSAGSIFIQMIRYINSLEETVIVPGDVDSRTSQMEETLNPVVLTDDLQRIVSRSGEGYRWRPEVTRGKLTIYADWFSDMVLETGLILQDGYNVSGDHVLSESAPINNVLAYGLGNDWEKRIIEETQDSESIQQYGLRQFSDSINTESVDSIKLAALTRLDSSKQPKYSFPLSALNKDDTFKKLSPGARATYTRLVGQGFSGNETGYQSSENIIRAMVFNPGTGTVALSL
jgi:hypothetical protein